ncbi:hypothetical protein PtA15_15A457 [Puccinia triticina]|uniref:DASH complex subunit DAD1 n=1 Tax=Puccinia triticina TaxID=208348 RepID=A0ABY7D384_9BASI|nr:uncharacterized protein PtA15_15A457 [Puccinia triticina]WAQ92061.1 hypothetical protein PtA15_15A457 [Puccinia triticina]
MDFEMDEDELAAGEGDQGDYDEDHSHFDSQRLKWIAEISESIGKLYTNLNALNRNIESVNSVGRQFENVYNLWSKFEEVISVPSASANSTSDATSPVQNVQTESTSGGTLLLTTSSNSGTVMESSVELRDPHLPPGVAPGGGMTSWGVERS